MFAKDNFLPLQKSVDDRSASVLSGIDCAVEKYCIVAYVLMYRCLSASSCCGAYKRGTAAAAHSSQLTLLLLFLITATPVAANEGSARQEFKDCMTACQTTGCLPVDLQPWQLPDAGDPATGCNIACAANAHHHRPPLALRLMFWDCPSDCAYHCMWAVERRRGAAGEAPVLQYYRKWPFMRVLGVHELFSVVFSAANLVAHVIGYSRVVAAVRRRRAAAQAASHSSKEAATRGQQQRASAARSDARGASGGISAAAAAHHTISSSGGARISGSRSHKEAARHGAHADGTLIRSTSGSGGDASSSGKAAARVNTTPSIFDETTTPPSKSSITSGDSGSGGRCPYEWLWLLYGLTCINTWVWSVAFHIRHTPVLERLDYFSVDTFVATGLLAAITRTLRLAKPLQLLTAATAVTAALACHISYMAFRKFDVAWNMKLCISVGVVTAGMWLTWAASGSNRHPGKRQLVKFIVLVHAALVFEVLDFPPLWDLLDAHALWHALTVPLAALLYDFMAADVEVVFVGGVEPWRVCVDTERAALAGSKKFG